MKKLILAILLASGIQAHAGNDGGGGGGFCFKETRCITLAEAGFRLQEINDVLVPTLPFAKETFEEAKRIITSLPVRQQYKAHLIDLLGNMRLYIRTTAYNKDTLKKIKKDYQDVLKKQDYNPKGLVIYALSNKELTYLLPEFYKLNIKSQALILIHESWVRWSGSFLEALKLDGIILDLLAGKDAEFDFVEMTNPLIGLKYYLSANEVCSDCNTALLFTYADIHLKNNKSYLALNQIVPIAPSELESKEYCLNLEEEVVFYEKHTPLYEKLKKYKMALCFSFAKKVQFDSQTNDKYEQELNRACDSNMNGYFIAPINHRDFKEGNGYSNRRGFPVTTPVIECKEGRTLSVSNIYLKEQEN